jgi:hypothetical protein
LPSVPTGCFGSACVADDVTPNSKIAKIWIETTCAWLCPKRERE